MARSGRPPASETQNPLYGFLRFHWRSAWASCDCFGVALRPDAIPARQDTDAFRKTYRKRAGIEGTNSGLKRVTGLDKLRVRRAPAVRHAVYRRVAGWNILRAVAAFAGRAAKANKQQVEAGAASAQTGTRELLCAALKPANRLHTIRLDEYRVRQKLSLAA